MNKLTYYCPDCKKERVLTTKEELVPASMLCVKCRSQTWFRKTEKIEEATAPSDETK